MSGVYKYTVKELVEKLEKANEAYYNDESLMSDPEFDALRDELKQRDPKNKFLEKVGATPRASHLAKVKHETPMGSLEKINLLEGKPDPYLELRDWASVYTNRDLLHLGEKFDGFSIDLTYEDGVLVGGATRGDDGIGEDITANISKVPGVQKTIPTKKRVHVRGEAVLTFESFKTHFLPKGYKNTRNAMGRLRSLDGDLCEHFRFFAHNFHGDNLLRTEEEKYKLLGSWGFDLGNWSVCSMDDVITNYIQYMEGKRSSLPYAIDGLVIRENDLARQEQEGVINSRPKAQRAFKFPSIKVKTKLLEVLDQTGRTGIITPVGIIEPTDIDGITVNRVSLCNYTEIKRLGLGIGAECILQRSNDVIPKIIETVVAGLEINPPSKCPSCGSAPVMYVGDEADHYYCENINCPAQIENRFHHFLKSMNVKGMGDVIVSKLIEIGSLKELPDIFKVSLLDFAQLERVGEKVATKILNEIDSKCREATMPKFIECLGIPGVGEGVSKILLENGYNLDKMLEATEPELVAIKGIGDHIAKQTVEGLRDNASLIKKMRFFIQLNEPKILGDKLKGKSFCFTGFRSPEMEEKIQGFGGTIASGVSKKTTFLVCKDPSEGSGKTKKAIEVGCKVISPDELTQMLEG